jgi:molybdopterin synthase sulfur carrier subunit
MHILYFASLKESLQLNSEEISIKNNICVADLKEKLIKKHGKIHFPDNILCAINHEIAQDESLINPTDEVAFYPPVTGG